ncbi:MAG: hypothetical protein U0451_02105 [Candidatus Saccharimonadales bacterium]
MTRVRRETPGEALRKHTSIEVACNSELDVVTLPPVSTEERVSLAQIALRDRGVI